MGGPRVGSGMRADVCHLVHAFANTINLSHNGVVGTNLNECDGGHTYESINGHSHLYAQHPTHSTDPPSSPFTPPTRHPHGSSSYVAYIPGSGSCLSR